MRGGRNRIQERIVEDGKGMGGFLDPPEYPTHRFYIETDLNRQPQNRGMCSIKCTDVWIDSSVRMEALALLQNWHDLPPLIDSEPVTAWIRQVLGYYRNCYRAAPDNPNVRDMLIVKPDDIHPAVTLHAGVLFVRQFYPDWWPTRDDWNNARWGS